MSKYVNTNLSFAVPYTYQRLSAGRWVQDAKTGSACFDNVLIKAGGYGSSFAEKLALNPGGLITGPLEVVAESRKFTPGSATRIVERLTPPFDRVGEIDPCYMGVNLPAYPSTSGLLNAVRNDAATRTYRKWVRDRHVLMGVILKEASQSVDAVILGANSALELFKASENRLRAFFRKQEAAVRRKPRHRRTKRYKQSVTHKILRRISSEWLLLSFGLAPLVSDLEGVAKASYANPKRFKTQKIFAASSRAASSTAVMPLVNSRQGTGLRLGSTAVAKSIVTVKHRSIMRVGSANPVTTSLGMTFRDLPASIWECIPYSWLADYFSNAGVVIDALSQFTGTNSKTQITTVTENVGTHSVEDYSFVPQGFRLISSSIVPSKTVQKRRTIDRVVSPGIPTPGFEFSLPGRSGQQLNLLAFAYIQASQSRLSGALRRIVAHF